MADVKINRELLTDVADDLEARHVAPWGCPVCGPNPCPTAQRIARLRGALDRQAAKAAMEAANRAVHS